MRPTPVLLLSYDSMMVRIYVGGLLAWFTCLSAFNGFAAEFLTKVFFTQHCTECHDTETKKGNLDLTALKPDFADAENFARWVKVHDRIESGEMPPKKKTRPSAADTSVALKSLRVSLLQAEQAKLTGTGRTGLRQLTRAEYENTIRDLFDMPGFALESFDVIGGWRERYRSISAGDPAPRGAIDPFIGISFKLGPKVDASGALPDERKFADIREFQTLAANDATLLLKNLAQQLAIYATGRELAFSDRDQIAAVVASTQKQGGGVRTLVHELTQSQLFQTR